jgi:beta-galactosidase
MKPITFDKVCYRISNDPVYLLSGEMHYFRVPKKDWAKRMTLLKEAGGNCVSTYIPWMLHEPKEGEFIFGGPEGFRDLEGFLAAAKEAGLYVIAKPGPYQYSELVYGGLPRWVCDQYPELMAHNIEGKPFKYYLVSYLHPLFLAKVEKWFDRVIPVIGKYTVANGGSVAFIQLDNEILDAHLYFGGLDYNAATMGFGTETGRYPAFLRGQYENIESLNRLYETKYTRFAEVRPIAIGDSATASDLRRRKDYLDFFCGGVAEYLHTLGKMVRKHDPITPLFHNSGSPGMNPLFCRAVEQMGDKFLLGSDHYYNMLPDWAQNNPTPQDMVKHFCSLEMLRLLGFPPTVNEMQSGSLSDWPVLKPEDQHAFYLMNLACGMKGSNYYIFTGGPNPPGAGTTTELYDYNAPVGPTGEVRPLYHAQKEFGTFIHDHPWLVQAEQEYDCRFAFDFEYARSAFYWKKRGSCLFSSPEAWEFFRKGPLTSAFCAGFSPKFCNLATEDWVEDTQTPVILVASSSMAAEKQRRVVRFLKNGGKLLITPVLPEQDENFNPCTILCDFLGSPKIQVTTDFLRLTVGKTANIYNNGEAWFTDPAPAGADILGRDDLSGRTIAWQLNPGVIFLAFRWTHCKHEHADMLKELMEKLGIQPRVRCSNPNVWPILRTAGETSLLFLANLFTSPQEAHLACRCGSKPDFIDLGQHHLAPLSVKTMKVKR